jgi:hypothetical protein
VNAKIGGLMALYDYVRTNYKFPDIEVDSDRTLIFNAGNRHHFGYETNFHTSDFDCNLDLYFITSYGRLMIKEGVQNVDTEYDGIMTLSTVIPYPLGGGFVVEYQTTWSNGDLLDITGNCIVDTTKDRL